MGKNGAPGNANAIKALLIDDDALTRTIISVAMRDDFLVEQTESGAEAVAHALRVLPAVILLDLHMPNVDGYEVLRQLKLDPRLSSIPVICMTGENSEASRRRTTDLGAVGHLRKPLDVKTIAADIRSLLATLNVEMRREKRAFIIGFNQAEKARLIRMTLDELYARKKRTVMLSLVDGRDFCTGDLEARVHSGDLVYLQISPSLMAKLPYLGDLTPVLMDLRELVAGDLRECAVVFDDPALVLNIKDPAKVIARMHLFKEILTQSFGEAFMFCARERDAGGTGLLNEMAELFCN